MNVTQVARKDAADEQELEALLEATFARYQSELLGTLYYLVGNIEDARDALQETFLKCWKHSAEIAEVKAGRVARDNDCQ